MAFRFQEKPGSGNSEFRGLTREKLYYASGSVDENFVLNAAAAGSPVAIFAPNGKLFRQEIRLNWTAASFCEVSVTYGPRDPNGINVQFDTSGGTAHITSSKSTVSRWGIGGLNDAPDMQQTIGVNGDDVDGCDIVVPALKLSYGLKHPQGVITMAQVRNMARYTGYVNQDLWQGFNPGEVLFLGATGGWGPETETNITYSFMCAENATEGPPDTRLNIGDILNVVKQGHDYAWIRYSDDVDAGRPVKVAKHVYVERVYARASFAGLFPWGV